MYKGIKIAAVVPVHNEASQIKEVIVTMPEIVDIIGLTLMKSVIFNQIYAGTNIGLIK